MWIVDDDGDMFNTDKYEKITFKDKFGVIYLHWDKGHFDIDIYKLSKKLTKEERLARYHDLVEKLTGEKLK